MDELTSFIRKTVEEDSSGITEVEMIKRGYRLITAEEYLEALRFNQTAIHKEDVLIWRRIDENEDDATTVAFAFPVYPKYTNDCQESCSVVLTAHDYDGETDAATTISAAETVPWPTLSSSGTFSNLLQESICSEDTGNWQEESAYVANEGICTATQAKTLWGDLKF